MANRHDDAAVIVTNGTPFRNGAVASVAPAAPEGTCPGNLNSIVQIIEDVKYFILISQLFDRPPGKDHFHAAHKGFPFIIAVRSEEHTSELQSLRHLVCRLLLEK